MHYFCIRGQLLPLSIGIGASVLEEKSALLLRANILQRMGQNDGRGDREGRRKTLSPKLVTWALTGSDLQSAGE